MEYKLLYYVAVPLTEEMLDLVTFFAIEISNYRKMFNPTGYGLFIYEEFLEQEYIDTKTEWLLSYQDSIVVLAHYTNKDYKAICEYLNSIANRSFNVEVGSYS